MKLVQGMEQTYLSLLFALDELDVLYDQKVHVSELASELIGRLLSNRVHEFSSELFPTGVTDREAVLACLITYSMYKVSLAQATATIDEKGVVVVSWVLSYSDGSGEGKAIGGTDNKALESVAWVEAG